MLRKKNLFHLILTLAVAMLFNPILDGQNHYDHGILPVYNFTSKAYNAQEMNVAIAQDNRGLVYFANTSGILEYDGINWRLIKLVNEKVPRSLATDTRGRIYVGSESEIGYLAPDSIGNMQYFSLMNHIPEKLKDFQVVWNVYAKGNEVFFQTDNTLFIWNGEKIRTISSSSRIHEFFLAGDSFFARIENIGLAKFDGEAFHLIPGGDYFSKRLVYGVVLVDSNKYLIATDKEGLYIYSKSSGKFGNEGIKPFKTQADSYFRKHTIFNAQRLGDLISIGTWGGGLVILNLKGEIHSIIEKEYGLQDQIILDQMSDSTGNIWLALSKGISRIEVISPLSLFNNQNGLQGTVQSITTFEGLVYAATTVGVFYLDTKSRDLGFLYNEPFFKAIEGLTIECWDLLDFKTEDYNVLLCIANDQIWIINKSNKIEVLMPGIAYDIYQSKLDPARVFVGLENGLTSFYFEKGKWIKEEKIKGIDETISSISEDHLGNLWMGTLNQGIIKMNIKSFKNRRINDIELFKFGQENGVPTGPTQISIISGRLIIGTSKGLYKFVPVRNVFEPDSSFGVSFADGSHYIHRISDQKDDKVWMVTFEQARNKYCTGYLSYTSGKGYQWNTKAFSGISENVQHSVFQAENGKVWFGGPDGIYRFDPNVKKNYNFCYHTIIRMVTLSNGDTIFGGSSFDTDGYTTIKQPVNIKPVLPYSQNSISFNFAAQSGDNETLQSQSYFLEGYDKKWSDWSVQNIKEYTNLNEGTYILRVRSKNIYGNEGTEGSFKFTILSPWYRTIVAYVSYAILLALMIFGIVKVYTKNLRNIIQERTAEVVKQKTEIEIINKEITDSIHYARRIQSAILPPEEYLKSILNDYFILYMPRDIVSGDFYWMHSENGRLITVTADCTGHGVPGAFMSMLGIAFLNEIIIRHEDKSADKILNELRSYVIKSLRQTGREGENQDGMDLSLCIYDLKNMKAQFSGANNSLLLIRNDELIVYPADKMPIGIHLRSDNSFTLHEIDLKKDDIFYTFSDGFVDQFGGEEGKKFMMKRLKELLISIHREDMKKQGLLLSANISDWMTGYPQVDDILLMGIKI
jgi:serine phosphatase RsbU (regulator of sigma subunit)